MVGGCPVLATTRFNRAFQRAQPLLKACAIGAFRDLLALRAADPVHWSRRYNTLKGFRETILEVDVAGGERMLIHLHGAHLVFLELGSHQVVNHYTKTANLALELGTRTEPPRALSGQVPLGFFTFDVEDKWRDYANEADPSWLTYLDEQQAQTVASVLDDIECRRHQKSAWHFALIAGGPGTGKTSVLLNLMEQCFSYDLIPEIVVSDAVAAYIKAASCIDLDSYRTTLRGAKVHQQGDVLLLDDPEEMREIEDAKWLAQQRSYVSVLVGVDPLQMLGDPNDDFILSLQDKNNYRVHTLSVCYRQKEQVGRAAKRAMDAIAESSPFLDVMKKRDHRNARIEITRLCNDLRFSNPSGRAKVYRASEDADLEMEIDRILRSPHLWNHWPPVLIATDDEHGVAIPDRWEHQLSRLPRLRRCDMSDAASVKGLEFQHVLLFISYTLFMELESGFDGSGRRTYQQRRLYRIPLTRAKDSIVVFVV